MSKWNCRIGKVTPRLSIYRDPKVEEIDWSDETGFIEEMITTVRDSGAVRGYTIIVTHKDGSVTRGTKGVLRESDFQMLGAVAYELVSIVDRIKGSE